MGNSIHRAIGRANDFAGRASYLRKGLKLTWRAAPTWTLLALVLTAIEGLLPVAMVYLTKHLVDGVASVIGAGLSWSSVQPVLLPGGLMVLVLLLTGGISSVLIWIRSAQAELVEDYIKELIHEQSSRVDLAFFETPDQLDAMQRANSEASRRSLSILQNIGAILRGSITLTGVVILLVPYSPWLAPLLVISGFPTLWTVMHHHRLHHEWWKRTTAERRWTEYYDDVLTSEQPAAELRLFKLHNHFRRSYRDLRGELRQSRLRLLRNQNVAQQSASMLSVVVTGGALAWMFMRAIRGLATLGDLALFYQAFRQGQFILWTMLRNVGQLYSDTLFLEHLFSFLEIKPTIADPEQPDERELRLQNEISLNGVWFAYPGTDVPALRGVDMVIPAGNVVAVVGLNGAGKSTLVKLLCRFYDPTEGSISIDGVDIRRLPVDRLRSLFTVLFQRPVNYVANATDNIRFGTPHRDIDAESIRAAAVEAGAASIIERLPSQYDTLLSKRFPGGTELSEGQKQRVALARAIHRDAQVTILDEPTSFMDSWAEFEWLDRFYTYIRRTGGTAIIITHRFSTAMRADLIYVMDAGEVVEQGTHEELIAASGRYAASWKVQMAAGAAADDLVSARPESA